MTIQYQNIKVYKYKQSWWSDDFKEWSAKELEEAIDIIVEGMSKYNRGNELEKTYMVGAGGRIVYANIKSEDGLVKAVVEYHMKTSRPKLSINIEFEAEGEEFKEDYLALEKLVDNIKGRTYI